MGYNSIAISQTSLQYVGLPVQAQTLTGISYNPTADNVVMAFLPTATSVPQVSDWQTARWATRSTNLLYPYAVFCLVGPGGTIQLGVGTWYVFVKVTDNPEIPVLRSAMQLEVY